MKKHFVGKVNLSDIQYDKDGVNSYFIPETDSQVVGVSQDCRTIHVKDRMGAQRVLKGYGPNAQVDFYTA